MNAKGTLSQRIARYLTALASNAMQEKRADWAQAMRNEREYVPPGFAALRWSIGCLFASYKQRAMIMEIGSIKTTRISRIVLTLEMLLCFLVPTQALLAVFFIGKYVPVWTSALALLLLTTSLVGPFGLYLAFKAIVLDRRQMSTSVKSWFCALAGWTLVGNIFFVLSVTSPGYELRAIILMALLPAVGAVHLVYLANMERSELAPA